MWDFRNIPVWLFMWDFDCMPMESAAGKRKDCQSYRLSIDRFVNSGGLVYIISEKILHFYSNISQNIANFELLIYNFYKLQTALAVGRIYPHRRLVWNGHKGDNK